MRGLTCITMPLEKLSLVNDFSVKTRQLAPERLKIQHWSLELSRFGQLASILTDATDKKIEGCEMPEQTLAGVWDKLLQRPKSFGNVDCDYFGPKLIDQGGTGVGGGQGRVLGGS